MNRGIAYRRDIRNRKISRKKRLSNELYNSDWYKHDGQYSKGKIHCSCKMCKFSRHFGLTTVKMEREISKFRSDVEDYYNSL